MRSRRLAPRPSAATATAAAGSAAPAITGTYATAAAPGSRTASPTSAATIRTAITAPANSPSAACARIVKVAEAPGQPFDFGRFEIVVEDTAGQRVAEALARDTKKRPRGRKLVLCM